MISHGLVVDSRLFARRELVRDLKDSGLVREVIEAQSVDDALFQLESRSLDACLVGPTLSEKTAVRLISEGRDVARRPDCAFIVVGEGQTPGRALLAAGAHGSVCKPYNIHTFTEVVESAVTAARSRYGMLPRPESVKETPLLQPLERAQADLCKLFLDTNGSAAKLLTDAAAGLRLVAHHLTWGKLSLRLNGEPSLATRDAIRLVLEQCLPEGSKGREIGSRDHALIAALVDWFARRVAESHVEATDRLAAELAELRSSSR